jgi:antitoxin (DNA-binding transcriptional repressor) of toxin-antitoxin stability system
MAEYTRKHRPASSNRSVPATEAAKSFGQLVDRVRESRAVYTIERGGVPVAEIGPVMRFRCTVADLVAALKSDRGLPEEYLAAVASGVRSANRPEVPRNRWER